HRRHWHVSRIRYGFLPSRAFTPYRAFPVLGFSTSQIGMLAGARNVLAVPMLKERELVGVVSCRDHRRSPRRSSGIGGAGRPCGPAPRVLSRQEWIEQYSGDKGPGEDDPTPP